MKKVIAALLTLTCIATQTTFAALATWTNAGGTNLYSNPLNWSTNVVPGVLDDLLFDNTTPDYCTFDQAVSVNSVLGNANYAGTIYFTTGNNIAVALDFTWNSPAVINANTGTVTIGRNFFMSAGSFINLQSTLTVAGVYAQNGITNTVDLSSATLATYNSSFTLQTGTYIAPLSQINKSNFTISGGTFNNYSGTVRFTCAGSTVIATSNAAAPIITTTQPFYNLILENNVIAPANIFKSYAISGTITVSNDLTYDYGSTYGTPSIITNKYAATAGVIVLKKNLRIITGASRNNYNGGSATIEFNSTGNQTIFSTVGRNILCNISITGPSRSILNSGTPFYNQYFNCMNFTCAASGSVTLNSSMVLKGDLTDNGMLNLPSSQITTFRNDAGSQNIYSSPTVPVSFSNLRVETVAPSTLILQGNVDVRDIMLFSTATVAGVGSKLNTNGKALVFKSVLFGANSTKTGMITDMTLTPNAGIIGNFTMERLLKGGKTGWTLLGSPFGAQSTLASWYDDFAMSGFTGVSSTNPPFTSVYSYDEMQPGAVGADAKYIAPTNVNDVVGTGKGWWCYVGNGFTTTTDILLDITGTLQTGVNQGNVNIPVTATPNNGAIPNTEDGWNLIANPYPGSMDYRSFRTDNLAMGLGATIYVYNPDLGADATYNASTNLSSPSASVGGLSYNLPSSRAFNAQVTSTGNLLAKESHKVASGTADIQSLWRKSASTANDSATQYFRINMLNVADNRSNDCIINFNTNATTGLDDYDALRTIKKVDSKASMMLMTDYNGKNYAINSLPLDSVNTTTLPLSAKVGTTGNYTLSASSIASMLPSTYCITLVDTKLNTTINLRTQSYTTVLDSLENDTPRFNVVIMPNTGLYINTSITLTNDSIGAVNVTPTVGGNYDFKLINTLTNITIATTTNATSALFTNVAVGNYKVQATRVGGAVCDVAETAFDIANTAVITSAKASVKNSTNVLYANGNLSIITKPTYQNTTINVYSTVGQLLLSKTITANGQTEFINLGNIASQTALVNISSNTENSTTKVVLVK
jgi:hypothetical protein